MKNNTFYVKIGTIIASVILVSMIFIIVFSIDLEPMPPVEPMHDEKLRIVTSFFPYYEFTKNVAQDAAYVVPLPLFVDAHDWESSSDDWVVLSDADVFVYSKLGIESYIDSITNSDDFDHIVFIDASQDIELLESESAMSDFHIWLDPILVKDQVNNIRDGLAKADPKNTQQYEKNAAEYNEKLDKLDTKIRSELSNCSKDTFVSFHNVFNYFSERYDLNVVSLSHHAHDVESPASHIAEFVDYIKENDIDVIFVESSLDPRSAQVIADESGAEVMRLDPIESLNEDETFFEKMEQNLIVLKAALQCQ
jgi:zinc transport system substrate-binding protein